jgi:hypothetical protein
MFASDRRISAYLDEVSNDPEEACQTLSSLGISSAVLRHIYINNNIVNCAPSVHKFLKQLIQNYSLSIAAIYSTLGRCNCNALSQISDQSIEQCFSVANYYKSSQLILSLTEGQIDNLSQVKQWATRISHASIKNNIKVLIELHPSNIKDMPQIIEIFQSNRRLKILYDPALLIVKQSIDSLLKIFSDVRPYLGAIDIRDYDTGRGPRLPGHGGSKLKYILQEIRADKKIELILEPGFGRRYNGEVSFEIAFKHFLALMNGSDMPQDLNETIQKIKQAGIASVRVVPMAGQTIHGQYQIEVKTNTGANPWTPIMTSLTKQMAEDIVQQATNKVLLG